MKNQPQSLPGQRAVTVVPLLMAVGTMVASLLVTAPRAAADIFPPQGDDSTPSMGLFRLVVAPAFQPLMGPTVASNGYPGYRSSDGRLTSPVLLDNATTIGRSAPHNRVFGGSAPVGVPSMGNIGYADFPATPFIFAAAPAPTREIFTRIRSFALLTSPERRCTNDARVPTVPLSWRMVYAGPDQGVARKSIGMVQENIPGGAAPGAADPDFPARSFFDIFVEVNLPPVPSTVSGGVFPVTGAVLYNDTPLVITNLDIHSLPPVVVYIHGDTPAVPLKFRDPNPPHWLPGDVFGYLVLAGHGTFADDCASEAALIESVLGPAGTSAPELAIEWPFPTDLCPSPNTTFNSVQNDDVVHFTVVGIGSIQVRNFVHSGLDNPISPPPLDLTSIYNDPNTLVTAEISIDGQLWMPAQASGPTMAKITHTVNNGPTRIFETEMLQLDLMGGSPLGTFMLRESPTRSSMGRHTIRPQGNNFLVSSFFDIFLELSTDGGLNWIPADRSVHVAVDRAPCGPAQLNIQRTGKAVVLSWTDPAYRLVGSPHISGPGAQWTDIQTTSPYTNSPSSGLRYFRLVCP